METNPELLAYLEEMARASGAAGNAADRMAQSIRDGLPNWDAANNGIRGLGNNSKEAGNKIKVSFDKFTTGLKSASDNLKSGFKSLGSESQSGAQAIKIVTDTIGGAISGFAGQFGIVGGAIGGFATLLTSMTGMALGFVDELTQTNKKLNETGIMFGDTFGAGSGIDEFDAIIKDSKLSAGMLNTVIDNSSESLRLFSGGAANGIRTVTQGFKKLRDANNGQLDSLYKLGYTTEDIMSEMADFGATARLAGQDLNMDQLAEGTTKYLTMQKELTRLTGTSVKEAKAREQALKADLAYQTMLREIGTDNAKVLTEVMTNVPKSLEPIVKTLITGGSITDQQMALLKNALGEDADFFVRLGEQARSINLDPKVVTDEFAGVQKRLARNIEAYGDQYGSQFIQTILNKGGPLAELFTLLGAVSLELEPGEAAAETLVDTTANVAKGMGNIATALPQIETASIALRAALYATGSALTATFAPLIVGLAGTVEGGAKAFQEALAKYSSGINQMTLMGKEQVGRGASPRFLTEKDREDAMNKVMAETLGSIAPEGSMFDNLFEKLGQTISLAIEDGFSQAVKHINPMQLSKIEAEEYEKSPELAEIKKIIEQTVPGKGFQSQVPFDDFIKITQYLDAFDPETRIKKMEELGLAEEELATDKFNNWIYGLFGSETNSKSLIKAKSYGDIMNPKPGGHIVRVAEAGQPEVIAPASRGPGGKLGLEVSGAMLDNSRLLQSLVKVNESQAAMMSGLNSQIANLNNNFEKMVYEQRQANRLAV